MLKRFPNEIGGQDGLGRGVERGAGEQAFEGLDVGRGVGVGGRDGIEAALAPCRLVLEGQ